jgi:hypothetical protein
MVIINTKAEDVSIQALSPLSTFGAGAGLAGEATGAAAAAGGDAGACGVSWAWPATRDESMKIPREMKSFDQYSFRLRTVNLLFAIALKLSNQSPLNGMFSTFEQCLCHYRN